MSRRVILSGLVCLCVAGCIEPVSQDDDADGATKALQGSPGLDRAFEFAFYRLIEGETREASAALHRLRSRPDHGGKRAADVLFWLGYCLEEQGRAREAAPYYRRITKEYPASGYAALSRWRLNSLDQAGQPGETARK